MADNMTSGNPSRRGFIAGAIGAMAGIVGMFSFARVGQPRSPQPRPMQLLTKNEIRQRFKTGTRFYLDWLDDGIEYSFWKPEWDSLPELVGIDRRWLAVHCGGRPLATEEIVKALEICRGEFSLTPNSPVLVRPPFWEVATTVECRVCVAHMYNPDGSCGEPIGVSRHIVLGGVSYGIDSCRTLSFALQSLRNQKHQIRDLVTENMYSGSQKWLHREGPAQPEISREEKLVFDY